MRVPIYHVEALGRGRVGTQGHSGCVSPDDFAFIIHSEKISCWNSWLKGLSRCAFANDLRKSAFAHTLSFFIS